MEKDAIGYALSAVSKFAGSSIVNKLKLRKPVEKIAYYSTRTGFQVLNNANQQYMKARQMLAPSRANQKADRLFDLSLSEEQQLVTDSLRRFASEIIRPAAFNSDEQASISAELQQSFDALGLLISSIPERLEGGYAGPTPVDNCLIYEQLAYGDLSLALGLSTTAAACRCLATWATSEQQDTWLMPLANNPSIVATIALTEASPLFSPYQLKTTATPNENGYRLTGRKAMVANALNADFLIVAAQLPQGRNQLFIVDTSTQGIDIVPEPGMGLHACGLAQVTFKDVDLDQSAMLGDENFSYETFINQIKLAACALSIGTAQAVLDYVTQYANERTTFGNPISHKQSIAFMIADMAIELESMRLLTYRAAARMENGLPHQREAYLAHLQCSEKSMQIATNGVQILGGHGFIKEHPVERWYRDLRSISCLYNGLSI